MLSVRLRVQSTDFNILYAFSHVEIGLKEQNELKISPELDRTRGPIETPYLMKVVFPVEYWPTTSTMGLLSKSASSRLGEWKSWKP